MNSEKLRYMTGFGNSFESEALVDALPKGRNSPQKCNYGLYAEQLSGTAFTMPQHANQRSWLYRIRPSAKHVTHFRVSQPGLIRTAPAGEAHELPIGVQRWQPMALPEQDADFVRGMISITTAGNSDVRLGMAAHVYACNRSMEHDYFVNHDGEYLILPELNGLRFHTEFGVLEARPGEAVIIPRGIVFRVVLTDKVARGYICENYGTAFALPDRGPIGANGLANPRDFKYPVAAYEDKESRCRLWVKSGGGMYTCDVDQSPLDVVAWHGNYAPYKYDLRDFSPVGAIGFDHPDPSIFTVLTSPSSTPGTANVDFVIFPERWLVGEDTFRPPWYHRNIMSEFMGLIYGIYDAKQKDCFVPGGMSLHNSMLPHGPDFEAFEKASNDELRPVKLADTMAFMFESWLPQKVTQYAAESPMRQRDYIDCWKPLKRYFEQ